MFELDAFLNQCVSADENGDLARGGPLQELRTRDFSPAVGIDFRRKFSAAAAGNQADVYREISSGRGNLREIFYERFEVLAGENLGRRHVSGLERAEVLVFGPAGCDCVSRSRGHGGLARAHVAFEKPAHGMAFSKILQNM